MIDHSNHPQPADSPSPVSIYVPEKPNHLRTAVKNLLYLLIFHGASLAMHFMVLGTSDRYQMSSQAAERIRMGMFLYSIVAFFVLGDILVGLYWSNKKRKRAYLDATSVEKRGEQVAAEGVARYRRLALIEGLVCTLPGAVLYCILSVVYTVSLALVGRGYSYTEATIIEQYFVGFIGLCEPFDNAWIGWLIATAVLFGFNYFGRLIVHSRWDAQRIRR